MSTDRAIRRTARLVLRPVEPGDAGAIAAGISDWEVIRWLTTPPWPYGLADAQAFLSSQASEGAMAMIAGGHLAGIVHIGPTGELGYWLERSCHGKGYMTEAASALVSAHFAGGGGAIWSGHLVGNAASRNVLTKLGFRDTEVVTKRSEPLKRDVEIQRMELSPEGWGRHNPLVIDTPRLRLGPLDADRDWRRLSGIGGDRDVARMLYSVRSPWSEAEVRDWITRSAWRGCVGFRLGIWQKAGDLIGSVGVGGSPTSVAYFLDRAHWGRGYATEAMVALMEALDARFGPKEYEAEHFGDNPASGRVLQKIGFAMVCETLGRSGARLLPAPMFLYRRAPRG